ncbi:MAG TPA: TonB family protein [Terriglobales bacterium]|nr:TonB family protein [Terriglobales bacterium]
MPLLQENQATEIKLSFGDDSAQKQRRQMLIALTLLLAALILTLTKDREFWFPPAPALQSEAEPLEETSPQLMSQSEAATTTTQPALPARQKAKPHAPPAAAAAATVPAGASAPVAMSRTVLPPLQVEVVAGDEHRTIQAGSNSVNVDLRPPSLPAQASSPLPTSGPAGVVDATARVRLSPGAAQILSRPVEPNYPLLAKEMKIQGAVVLEVLVGRDGNIQHLHVLSGPTILSAAAREAVKQWRFKPYLQSGQAVETEARITVNFTIFTQ